MKHTKSYVIIAAGIALFGLGFFLLKAFTDPYWISHTFPYLCIGVGCGAFGHGLGDLLSKKAREKDPEMAKQLDIELNDERNVQHMNASKAKAFDMMTYVFGALMLAYGLMNASLSILLTFVAAYLFIQFYALYYRFKMDRED